MSMEGLKLSVDVLFLNMNVSLKASYIILRIFEVVHACPCSSIKAGKLDC